jgi:hypothetical protein
VARKLMAGSKASYLVSRQLGDLPAIAEGSPSWLSLDFKLPTWPLAPLAEESPTWRLLSFSPVLP